MERLVDRAIASYGRYWAESLRLPGLTRSRVNDGIDYDGFDRIAAGVAAGKGTILALPHLGGWEWAGTHLARLGPPLGVPLSVVVEKIRPDDLYDWFIGFRRSLGMNVISAGPGAAAECARALADNHILCLLSDRLIAGTAGVELDFFGEPTFLPAGPATLALRSGAALLPAAVYFGARTDAHLGVVLPALDLTRQGPRLRDDVGRITRSLAESLEELIRREPAQWHMLQPNWPSDRIQPARPGPEVA